MGASGVCQKSLKRRLTTGNTSGDYPALPYFRTSWNLIWACRRPRPGVFWFSPIELAVLPQATAGDIAALARSLW